MHAVHLQVGEQPAPDLLHLQRAVAQDVLQVQVRVVSESMSLTLACEWGVSWCWV